MTDRRNIPLIAGLCMLPALVFQFDLLPLLLQLGLLIIIRLLQGGRIRVKTNLMMIVTITAVNLLQAHGQVLYEIAGFEITLGALRIGLVRSLKLIALIYLSQFMISQRPAFPGRLGNLLSLQFSYYEGFLNSGLKVNPKQFIQRLDELLFQLEEHRGDPGDRFQAAGSVGWIPAAAAAAAFWVIYATAPLL